MAAPRRRYWLWLLALAALALAAWQLGLLVRMILPDAATVS